MQSTNEAVDLKRLRLAIIEDPTRWALLLDIDGTLIDIAPTPEEVVVPPTLVDTLAGISSGLAGRLALVTGRSIGAADRLLFPLKLPAAGIHGAELRRAANGPVECQEAQLPESLVASVERIARDAAGARVERKGVSLTIHFRNSTSDGSGLETRIREVVNSHSPSPRIQHGRKVLELLPAHVSKAKAMEAILQAPPFRGRRPITIGDDAADEPGFALARRFGGVGLRVAGEHFRRDEANFLQPEDVRNWLGNLAARLTRN